MCVTIKHVYTVQSGVFEDSGTSLERRLRFIYFLQDCKDSGCLTAHVSKRCKKKKMG